MLIPDTLRLALVAKVTPEDGGPWWQHQRDDAAGVGVLINCRGRGHPQIEEWYADALINRTFLDFKSMQTAATAVSEKEAASVLNRYPFLAELDSVANPGPGHGVPRCMVNTGQVATHVGILVEGWHRQRSSTVFLGKAAVLKLRKDRNPAFIIAAIAATRKL